MNYLRIYNELVTDRQSQKRHKEMYTELHHIVPKCLGGTNLKENLVKLTAREHYLAHWLLTKIYPDNIKLLTAFTLMAGKMCPTGQREVTSAQFERCKKAQSKASYLHFTENNPMNSPSAREKVRQSKLGDKNPMRQNPGNSWKAKAVEVTFEHGGTQIFPYGTLAAKELGIPYATWKWALKHNNGKIPKYQISAIKQQPKI